jgi:hypothetical protein
MERLYDRFDLGLDVRQGKTVSDANRLRVLKNAHPTTGRFLRKRPCLKLVATLESGTVGLKGAGGKLNTFYATGSITHANSLFKANLVPHPDSNTATEVASVHYCDAFLGYLYASIEYDDGTIWHHYLDANSSYPSTTDKSSVLTVSGNVVTHDGTTTAGALRVNYAAPPNAAFYVEFVPTVAATNTCVGLGQLADALNAQVGTATNSVAYRADGAFRVSNSTWATWATYTTGDVIGMALNKESGGARQVAFYKNNTWQGQYNMPLLEWYVMLSMSVASGVVTLRTDASQFTYSPPSGYLPLGDYRFVRDTNCPHSKSVVKAIQSLFGPKGENVRFCATDNARDWTTASDAGFLPVGVQAEGTTEPIGVGTRKEQLAVFFIDGVQIWNVDPDPTKMALASRVGGVGCRFPKTAKLVSGDLFFLSDYGFKSITVTEFETNLRDVDIGSPIDDLIRNQLGANDDPLAVYYQANGQYLVIFPTTAWCFTFSRSAKLAGWSQFTFPVTISDATELNAKVYLRSGDNVYELDTLTYKDGDSSIPLVEAEMPFVDMAKPGHRKMFTGFDFVGKGTAKMRFRLDPRKGQEDVMTEWVQISGDDTREGPQYPMACSAVSIAPVVHHQANEEFELHALNFYFEDLGPT